MEEKNCPNAVGSSTEPVAYDGTGGSGKKRCSASSKRRVLLVVIAFLSCFWLYSATFFYPAVRHAIQRHGHHHHHHHHHDHDHDHHRHYNGGHDGHKGGSVTVHAGEVFMIQWEPEKNVRNARISLHLHCVKTNTIVMPIAVNVKDTGNHPWAMPIDLKEGDAYVIQFVRHPGCGRKNRTRKPFYSQTFSVRQRNRRLLRRQETTLADPGTGDAPTDAEQAATDLPTAPVDTNTQAPPPVDTNTQAPPPDTPTPPPEPVPTVPTDANTEVPPPPETETPASDPAPPPTTPAEPESTPGESSSPPPSDTGSGSGPASSSSADQPLTTDEPAQPPPESSSTSTSFSQVIETILVTLTTTAADGRPTVAVQTSMTTSQTPVATVVSSVASGDGGGKSSSKIGPIVGGVVGGIVAIAAIAFLIWFIMRKRRRDKQRRYMTPDTPVYDHHAAGKPSPPISPYPDKSPTLPNLMPLPAPPPPRRLRPDQPAPGQGLAPNPQDPGHLSDESQMAPISELPADQEPAEMYAGPLPEDKAGTAMGAGGMYHELNDHNQPAPQYSAYVNGGNVSQHPTNPYFPPGAGAGAAEGYRGVPRYPDNPNSYGAPPQGTPYGGGGGSYQDRARAAYHDRGQSLTSNVSAPSAHSPVSPTPGAGAGGGLQHSASVASHGSGVSGVSGISGYQERLHAGNVPGPDEHGHGRPPQ